MHHFAYRDGVLHAEDVAVPAIAAAVGTPFYCYSTATLDRHYRVFTEALANALRGTGVNASVVLPGLTRTEFHSRAGIDAQQFPSVTWLSPIAVVAHALDAARRGRVIVTPSLRYQTVVGLLRVLPRWVVRDLDLRGD